MASGTEMKMGTKNAVLGTAIICAGSLAVRVISWLLVINGNRKIVEDTKNMILYILLAGALLPIINYLMMYNSYSKKGAHEPMKLRAIAQGQSWVLPFAILIIAEVVLVVVMFAGIAVLDGRFASKAVTCEVIGMVVDIVLFLIGKMLFKPDMIQKA